MSYQRYRLEKKEQELKKMDIQLLYITQALYEADWQSVMHTHHFTELFYVVSGQGNFVVENKRFTVKKDDVIIINPNVTHTEYGDKHTNLEYIVLGIEGLQFQFQDSDKHYDYSLHNFHFYREDLMTYMKLMIQEVQKKEENFEFLCQDLLECLIFNLIRRTKDNLSFAPAQKTIKECRFIEQYLDKHFAEEITLQTLSDLTYMNKYYLVHAFKAYKGASPINYLIERRIAEAKYLLETSNYPISKISHAVGFSSQSYFSQVFRKETGTTPNRYRDSQKAPHMIKSL